MKNSVLENGLRVCLSSPYAYPLFDGRDSAAIGGAETHAWLIARGLRDLQNLDVNVVVRARRWFRTRRFDGIKVWNIGDGFDGLRRDVSEWKERPERRTLRSTTRLIYQLPALALAKLLRGGRPVSDGSALFRRLDADCYACFGVSLASLVVCRAAHAINRPVVLFLESNNDLDDRFRVGSRYRTPYGECGADCAELILSADAIVAQSHEQQLLLKSRFGRDSQFIVNPFDFESWERRMSCSPDWLTRLGWDRYLLWIGRADRHHKRPHLCLEVAKAVPEARFLMLLNRGDAAISREIRASAPANVKIVEQVPYQEMPAVFARSVGYISTGAREYEGAPHVFLQAAASGVPIASLEVDGDVLLHTQAGVNAQGDLVALTESVRSIWAGQDQTLRWGQAGRLLVKHRYDLETISDHVRSIMLDLSHSRRAMAESGGQSSMNSKSAGGDAHPAPVQ